jgi:hypothetical protein
MDLFDPSNNASNTRQRIGSDMLDVSSFSVPPYAIPGHLTRMDASISDRSEIASLADIVTVPAIENGFPEGIFCPVYEAILNAYEHGNLRNRDKKVVVGFSPKAEYAVLDEGGSIHADLVSYVLALRERQNVNPFYDFSSKQKAGRNLGLGTKLMHEYFDIQYYPAQTGGLAVVLNPKPDIIPQQYRHDA